MSASRFVTALVRKPVIPIAITAIVAFGIGRLTVGTGGAPGSATGVDPVGDYVAAERAPTIWTCSMHPQIQMPEPGKCPICGMDLIPLVKSAEEEAPRTLTMSPTAQELAEIETAEVRRDFAKREVRMYGRITYDETRLSYITAWVPGRLDKLYADFTGVTVKKGDHMVYMYSPELLSSQEELLQASKAVRSLASSSSISLRETARATLIATREKLRLYGLTPPQIRNIEDSGKTTDHLTIYAPMGGVVVHKNGLEGMYVKTGERIYTIADLKHLWVLLEAYESDLPWLAYGQKLEFTSPSFPGERFSGHITFIDPLVDQRTRTVRVRALVENVDGRLKPDMFVRGFIQSSIDSEGHVLNQTLSGKYICPMHPEVIRDSPDDCDLCGMKLVPAGELGYVVDVPDNPTAPLLIPASAALITGKRAVVYVQRKKRKSGTVSYEGREVNLGPRAEDYYVVRSGLSEGERVVTSGAFKIDSELQIHARPSMMSPGGGAPPTHHHGDQTALPPDASDGGGTRGDGPVGSPAVRKAMAPVWNAYFDVREALAADDLGAARAANKAVVARTRSVDMRLFTGSTHKSWMALSARLLAGADEPDKKESDMESVRANFAALSSAMVELDRTFGHAGPGTHYVSFCPMALDGEGAYWLQTTSEISNPYFGQSMLYCGSVKQTIQPTE